MRESEAARRVLLVSTASFTLLFAVWLMLGVLSVPIKQELHLSQLEVSWLTAIAILSGSLFRLPFGVLADRVGGRRIMTALLLASALPCALVATARSFEAVMVYALLYGIAGNSFSVGVAWNAAWFSPERQGLALGTFGAGNVGASLTKLIGPGLIALVPAAGLFGGVVPGGWRFVPVLYAALLLIMAAAVWTLTPAPDRTPSAGRPLRDMLRPLRQVRVWRFGLYYVVVFGAYVAFALWLPSYYTRVFGMSLGEAALMTALFIFPASLLRPLGGWLADRHGARPVTYAVFAAMLVASLPLAASSHLGRWQFFALVEVLAVGMGIGKASIYKYIPLYFPRDIGLVGGLVGTLGALGGFLLPLAFGYLERLTGRPESCFAIMFGLVLSSFGWLHLVVAGLRRQDAGLSAHAPAG